MKKGQEKGDLDKINWIEIQNFYNQDNTIMDIVKKFNLSKGQLRRASAKNLFKARKRHTNSYKIRASLIRKEFLKNNPDKHSWRKPNKHKSKPCERAKEFLTSLNIQFVEEFAPEIEGRFFSIDIAMPDKMIALEINGQHHYENDGSLKPYYQERHDLLEAAGWRVFEIHYSACFNFEKWQEFILEIQNSPHIKEFDYFNYVPKPLKEKRCYKDICPSCLDLKNRQAKVCRSCRFKNKEKKIKVEKVKIIKELKIKKSEWNSCSCGQEKYYKSIMCSTCRNQESSKHIPPKEELEKLVGQIPMTHIGKMFGVSDNAVKKWCKKYQILLPNMRGYWMKKQKLEKQMATLPVIETGSTP